MCHPLQETVNIWIFVSTHCQGYVPPQWYYYEPCSTLMSHAVLLWAMQYYYEPCSTLMSHDGTIMSHDSTIMSNAVLLWAMIVLLWDMQYSYEPPADNANLSLVPCLVYQWSDKTRSVALMHLWLTKWIPWTNPGGETLFGQKWVFQIQNDKPQRPVNR